MTVPTRRTLFVLATGALALAGAALVSPAAGGAAGGHPPGVIGSPITLRASVQLVSYDVAANSAGRAYIGWMSDDGAPVHRYVHLCTLPVAATSCQGGVQTISVLDDAYAADLHVLVTGDDVVKLVWFDHSTPSTPAIVVASAARGQDLTAGQSYPGTTGLGQLLTAEVSPSGEIWTVTYEASLPNRVLVRPDVTAADVPVSTPYPVGHAQLAFTGGKAVLAFEAYSFTTNAAHYKVRSAGGAWGAMQSVPHTWTTGAGAALETTGHGLRIVTGVNDASYRPVIAKWTGSGFTPRQLTADHNACAPSSHDGYADPSGRLLDVSWECNQVTIANYPDALHAALVRISIGTKVATYTPQIASGTRGIATVVWSVQAALGKNVLRFAHVRLPDATTTTSHSGAGGKVTVTGPRTCLPPVNVHVGWTHPAANNWSFRAGSLRLGNTAIAGSTLDGASLTPGKAYSLIGTATFGRGGDRSTVKATLNFRSCGTG
ncbi:MAG: hypothetical protein QOJ34_2823 [Pseudonocardiales bacterium]|nr:hypothetical protein [Pseudonocardiales bacterium]